jgi:hypothetical protein
MVAIAERVSIYRFHEAVALYVAVPNTETVYLPPELARELAALLVDYADDCDGVKFTKSTLGTKHAGKEPD